MSKKSFILSILSILITTSAVFAETTIQQIQSPIYTDDIGRAHFLGKKTFGMRFPGGMLSFHKMHVFVILPLCTSV